MLRTLGRVELEPGGLRRPKPLLLLAYLAVEGPKERRHLCELFWPDAASAPASLRVALSQIRAASPNAIADTGTLLGPGVDSDVAGFLAAGRALRHEEALSRYAGAFLAGLTLPDWGAELEEWVYATRELFASLARASALQLALGEARSGNLEEAARWAELARRLPGAAPPSPDELATLLALAVASGSASAPQLAREAAEFGLEAPRSAEEARARLGVPPAAGGEGAGGARAGLGGSLPAARTSFVGRAPELVELGNLVASGEARLLTLLGPGGVGKTRLALEFARGQGLEGRFEGGLGFVALEGLESPAGIGAAIASSLGVEAPAHVEALEAVTHAVGNRRVLLVLDNFEHLVAGAGQVSALLGRCPGLVVVATSRERLGLEEEFALPLAGLPVPDEQGPHISGSDAVRLFAQRARQARLDFALEDADAAPVRAICRLVEGSPLGLELAAALVRVMTPAQIALEMARDLDLLQAAHRDVPDRHRSLRAVFERSWALLRANQQDALRRLGAFRGGFEREAAAEVAGATVPALMALCDKSLLRLGPGGRFERHALLEQYAQEKLRERSQDEAEARSRHAAHFLRLAEGAAHLGAGGGRARWYARLEGEHPNLRAALEWLWDRGEVAAYARLAVALSRFWRVRGHLAEGRAWLGGAASARDLLEAGLRVRVLVALAGLARHQGDLLKTHAALESALALARKDGDERGLAGALHELGLAHRAQGRLADAREHLEESLRLHRAFGDRPAEAETLLALSTTAFQATDLAGAQALAAQSLALHRDLGNDEGVADALSELGSAAHERRDLEVAWAVHHECLALRRDLGDRRGVATTLNNIANLAFDRGEREAAYRAHEGALDTFRALGDPRGTALMLHNMGNAALALGLPAARAHLADALRVMRAAKDRRTSAYTLELLARLCAERRQPLRAARLWGAVEALRSSIGSPRLPRFEELFAQRVSGARAQTDPLEFDAAWALGLALSWEEAVALALDDGEPAAGLEREAGPSVLGGPG